MKYEKPPTSLAEQLQLLDDRGMEIADPDAARFYLSHIGYYRGTVIYLLFIIKLLDTII